MESLIEVVAVVVFGVVLFWIGCDSFQARLLLPSSSSHTHRSLFVSDRSSLVCFG